MSTSRQVFSPAQRELLDAVLDRIIPPEGDRPGAGALGIGDFVESVAVGEPGLIRLFMQGLAAIEIAAAERGPDGFAACPMRPRTTPCGRWRRPAPISSTSWCCRSTMDTTQI